MLYVKLESPCDLKPLYTRWLFSDLLGKQDLANILQKNDVVAMVDNCGLDHEIHRWAKHKIESSYFRKLSIFFSAKTNICSSSLHLFRNRNLDENHTTLIPLHLLHVQCSIVKGLPLQLHAKKVCVESCCTKTDFCWMIMCQPVLLLSVLDFLHTSMLCLWQVKYWYCKGIVTVYFSLSSCLRLLKDWSPFLIPTR